MTQMRTSLGIAAAIAMMPALASATTVLAVDTAYSFSFNLAPGASETLEFEAGEDLDIAGFTISGTGLEADLEDVTFDYDDVVGDTFDMITVPVGFPVGFAGASIPGFGPFETGDMFSFTFNDGISNDVALTLSFATVEPGAPPIIPLPAGVMLLLSALGGAWMLRRRTV